MRDADDTVTGGPVVAVHECPCGTPVVVPLAGGACADCEPLPPIGFQNGGNEEVIRLYNLVRRAGGYGAIAWAVQRRKERPIPERVQRLKELDLWTPEMEALP